MLRENDLFEPDPDRTLFNRFGDDVKGSPLTFLRCAAYTLTWASQSAILVSGAESEDTLPLALPSAFLLMMCNYTFLSGNTYEQRVNENAESPDKKAQPILGKVARFAMTALAIGNSYLSLAQKVSPQGALISLVVLNMIEMGLTKPDKNPGQDGCRSAKPD